MPSKKQSEANTQPARPRFGRLPAATAYSGISRSSLYIAAGKTPGLFRKNGAAIVVDFDVLDRLLDALPLAKIRPRSEREAGTTTP
jgi:hypothetical protein